MIFVSVYSWSITNYHKFGKLKTKTISIYYFPVLDDQKFMEDLTEFPTPSLTKLKSRCQLHWTHIWRFSGNSLRLIQVVGTMQLCSTIRQRSPFFSWLLSGSLCQFLEATFQSLHMSLFVFKPEVHYSHASISLNSH